MSRTWGQVPTKKPQRAKDEDPLYFRTIGNVTTLVCINLPSFDTILLYRNVLHISAFKKMFFLAIYKFAISRKFEIRKQAWKYIMIISKDSNLKSIFKYLFYVRSFCNFKLQEYLFYTFRQLNNNKKISTWHMFYLVSSIISKGYFKSCLVFNRIIKHIQK